MIDWYIEISEGAPHNFRSDRYLSNVIETATPCMNYFCQRLTQIENWKLEDALDVFKDLINELPVMSPLVFNGEFFIRYNNWVYIKLTETPKQIYRDSKIQKLLV